MPSWWPSWSAWPPNVRVALPELRIATAADIPAMLEVFFTATEDLDGRRGRTRQPRNAAPLEMHFGHLLATDPRSCYMVDDRGRSIAFGMVMRRGRDAFLSFLFVAPAWQRRKLGRALLDSCLRAAGDVERVSTCAEADQPVSTGLYASIGMAPRAPLYLLRGALPEAALPDLPAGVRCRPISVDMVAEMDRALMGYERPQDHAFWAREREGVLFLDDAGAVLGYGYAHRSGRIGPVAAVEPAWLPSFIGYLVRVTPVLEGRQLVVPGHAITVLRPLLLAGLRIDTTPAIYCSEGPGPRFERYIPMSYALL
jgi:GNAT superfamily N-acetyltransferase